MAEEHEIHVFPLEEFLGVCKKLDENVHIDCVTLAQTLKDTSRAVLQIRLLGLWGDAYVKVTRGVEYLIVKGFVGLRRLQLTRALRTNPKVAMFVVGTKEIVEDAGKGIKVAVFAYVAIDVLEEILQDHWSLARLIGNVASHIGQAAISTAIGAAAGVVLTTLGAPIVLTFVVIVGTTFAVGWTLAYLDSRYGLTKKAISLMMEWENQIKDDVSSAYRIAREIRRDFDTALSLFEAAREGIERAKYARDRIERYLHGIPNFDDFLPFR